jgi:hypothetical protein
MLIASVPGTSTVPSNLFGAKQFPICLIKLREAEPSGHSGRSNSIDGDASSGNIQRPADSFRKPPICATNDLIEEFI